MKRVLIVHFANLNKAGRVIKEIEALKEDYYLDTIGIIGSGYQDVGFFKYKPNGLKTKIDKVIRLLNIQFFRYGHVLSQDYNLGCIEGIEHLLRPDIIIAHNSTGLYFSRCLCKEKEWDIPIILNEHEYEFDDVGNFISSLTKRPMRYYLRHHYNDACKIIACGEYIAREYEKTFNIPNGSVEVIPNVRDYFESITPHKTDENNIKLVHHGIAIPGRQLEDLVKIMDYLDPDRYSLHLYLMQTDKRYYSSINELCKRYSNIEIHVPVEYGQIPTMLNDYDIGISFVPPDSFNHIYCLPNKFFEFVQGRLAIAVGNSPQMAEYIERYDLGVYCNEYSSKEIASRIASLSTDDIERFKSNSNKHAYELSSEMIIPRLKKIVYEFIGK